MNYVQLARDLVHQLNTEDEDGTTPVHVMLDQAVIEASEQGAEAFAYLDEDPCQSAYDYLEGKEGHTNDLGK